jgi:2,3-dihydroxyphenylpropionate 1,2-dioxygenase
VAYGGIDAVRAAPAGEGGGCGDEVRTWIAAYSSLAATGPYRMTSRFYLPVPEWIAGFAVTTAQSQAASG